MAGSPYWPRVVRRYTLFLIALVAFLGLAAAAYVYMLTKSAEHMLHHVNEHHLASALHATGAEEEVSHIVSRITLRAVVSDPAEISRLQDIAVDHDMSVSLNLLGQRIEALAGLQRRFADPQFARLTDRVVRRHGEIARLYETYAADGERWGELTDSLVALRFDLRKLQKAHTIGYDEGIAEYADYSHRNSILFPIGIAVALLFGYLFFRVWRRAIDRVVIDQQAAEAALRVSEERYRLLAELSPLGILVQSDGAIVFCNPGMARILGAALPAELIGKPIAGFIAPEGMLGEAEGREGAIIRDAAMREVQLRRLDGTRIFAELTAAAVTWNEVPSELVIFQDIDQRKRAEERLAQAQRFEAVGQLTSGVAHEFNNIMTVVIGGLELANDKLPQEKSTTFEEIGVLIRRALAATWRGARLTERLLSYSRQQMLRPQAIEVAAFAQRVIEPMRQMVEESVRIEFIGGDDLWPCRADPGQLENALLSLAVNARDAMPQGGCLTIEAGNVVLGGEAAAEAGLVPGSYVCFAVSDTGAGIAKDALKHVFEPFFSTKDIGKGTGLGLSMVLGFAKQSGGSATIESELGVGTRVCLYLPRAGVAADAAEGESAIRALAS
jgi:PAS domain S-box-containing protein